MIKITVSKGNGIGPEIIDATLKIILKSGAKIEIEDGEKVYLAANTSGIEASSWDIIRENKIFLKAPITSPQGGGYKSLNVSNRNFGDFF
jgi:isocitrate dehydrogenase